MTEEEEGGFIVEDAQVNSRAIFSQLWAHNPESPANEAVVMVDGEWLRVTGTEYRNGKLHSVTVERGENAAN